ncbi:MAG: polysaccharide pyruvyl transferase family protein, partial [Bacillota bacterium]|nr:polysaccharide pyruvyl transferase family protein [Bacillota bacterium]
KAAKITVRDEDSAALLHRWGLRRGRIHVTADPVLTLGEAERAWDVERFVRAIEASLPETETEIEIDIVDEATFKRILADNAAKAEAEVANTLHKPINPGALEAAEEDADKLLVSETQASDNAQENVPEAEDAAEAKDAIMFVEGHGIMGQHPSLWSGEDDKLAIFSLRKWEGLPVEDVAAAADMTVKEGYKVVLLPFQYPADLEVSKEVQSAMTEPAEIFDSKTALSPQEILTIMDAADFVFGMRLHSLIMAVVTKTPFASLSYDPKVRSFVQQLGMNVTGDLEYYDKEEFLKNFQAALGALPEVSEIIEERLPELAEKADSVMDMLHLLLDRIERRNARKASNESYAEKRRQGKEQEKDEAVAAMDESSASEEESLELSGEDLPSVGEYIDIEEARKIVEMEKADSESLNETDIEDDKK